LSITDRHNNTITMAYRSDGQPDTITDTYGRATTFHYDTSSHLSSITNGSRTWSYTVTTTTSATVLSSYTNPDTKTTSYTYDTSDPDIPARITKITDARSHDITIAYNTGLVTDRNKVASITRVVDGAANDVTTSFSYAGTTPCSASAEVTKTVVTDPLSHATTYCANANGQVIRTFDAQARSVSTSYNSQANVATVTGLAGTANPSITTYAFSPDGRNATGSDTTVGSSHQKTLLNYCTDSGQPACAAAANGPYQPTKLTDSQGTATTFSYSPAGDLTDVQTGSATGDHQTLTYNSDGTIATSTDGNSHQTTYTYSGHFLTTVAQPTPLAPQSFTPDSIDRIHTAATGDGSIATITYDGEDRVTQVAHDSGGATFNFTYDNNGNVTQRTDSLGNTTTYTYDNLNRRLTESYSSGNTNTYTYDKAGNLKTIVDNDGTTTYAYDTINRLASITTPKPTSGTSTITFDYTDPAAPTDPSTQTASYPGGLSQKTTIDAAGNVLDVQVRNSAGTVLKDRQYSHQHGTGSVSALIQTMTDENGNTTTYTTVGPNRLGEAKTLTSGGSPVEDWVYNYDAAGNRTQRSHSVGSGSPVNTSYAYNQANEMCWSATGATTTACSCSGTPATCTTAPSGATAYTYNAIGERTTGMGYDLQQRLKTIGTTTVYNLAPSANGELVGYGTQTFQNNIMGLSREIPASGSATDIIRTPAGGAVAQRVGTTNKQELFTDALGSTIALADDGANTLSRSYTYDPDGNPSTSGTGPTVDLLFAGGHKLSTYYHYGARYYDPNTATWTQPDPINQIASLAQANRYAYAAGDPVDVVDPTGFSGAAPNPYGNSGRKRGHGGDNGFHNDAGQCIFGAVIGAIGGPEGSVLGCIGAVGSRHIG
jgi:RHS repeat-associated protein